MYSKKTLWNILQKTYIILWVGWINFLILLCRVCTMSYWIFDNLIPFIKIFMGTCLFLDEYLLQLLQMISIKQFPNYCTLSQLLYPCKWFATVHRSIVVFRCASISWTAYVRRRLFFMRYWINRFSRLLDIQSLPA